MTSRSKRPSADPPQSIRSARRFLPVAGLVMAAWALLPPYSGPALNTEMRVEVADHVIPALVMTTVSVAVIVLGRQRKEPLPTLSLVAGALVLLAGLWMVSTHVPLVAQATRGEVTWSATVYHAAPSLAVLALGLVWVVAHWSDAPS